ncbi:uncharacterized protein [Lolium perenne]|uniref:uncharacterized protein n=1 Tax=Lolium perenne TaxID=4522 RepID=UPI003A997B82
MELEEVLGDLADSTTDEEDFLAASDEEGDEEWHEQAFVASSDEESPEESFTDPAAYEARLYRDFWNDMFAGEEHGSYDTITSIPPMFFTDRNCTHDEYVHEQPTLQVFSVKVTEITGGLEWPLDVYGMVVARDVVDRNRNIIFHSDRDNCQTITQEDPCLALTGPTRAIVLSVQAAFVEVDLKVKGTTESEDRDLSFLAVSYKNDGSSSSYVFDRVETSRLSTLELTFGHIVNSVEATISMQVVRGSWPHGFRGVFTACTTDIHGLDVLLLSFGDGGVPVDEEGEVKLSRRVVSVEFSRPMARRKKANRKKPKLKISGQALHIEGERDVLKYVGFYHSVWA